jgi:CRISPR/Cas system-associated exonuclease Cas4 (RecB family)
VDLLVEDGDALVVSDLKTSRSRWSPQQAEDSAEQLLLYSQLAKRLQPGKSLRLEFLVLTKAKQPSVETHRVTLDPHRIARTKQVVRNVWQAIRSGTVYPSPSPMNCGSCPFQLPCREWAG